MLDSVNFGCFVLSRCEHFHYNAVRKSIKVRMNWYKTQQIEHTPGTNGAGSKFPIKGRLRQGQHHCFDNSDGVSDTVLIENKSHFKMGCNPIVEQLHCFQ